MLGVFWSWLAENYPVLIIIAVVAVIVWRASKFYYTRMVKAEERIGAAESALKNLPCGEREKSNQLILERLGTIITYLKTKDSNAAAIFSQKESPRKLNQYGQSLFEDCKGEEFLEQNKEVLLKDIAKRRPKTALDVENLANEVLVSYLDTDMFNELKSWVYNSPYRKVLVQGQEEEYAVSMNDVCFVLSLPLRDMYLALNPNLNAE